MRKNGKVVSGFFWRLAEKVIVQVISLIVSFVLARKLGPVAYGDIAIVTVFISISAVFVDGGLSTSLVQKKEADDTDFSSVFYFNLLICIICYFAVFFLAPLVALFFSNPDYTLILRVLAITILISGVKNVQIAYISKNFLFKTFFFATLSGTIVSGIVGIVMAYKGYGLWALVTLELLNNFIDTIMLWLITGWRPKKQFSFFRLRMLSGFGIRILSVNLMEAFFSSIRSFLIGKYYSSADLSYYNRGEKLVSLIISNTNVALDSVLLPLMSQEQDKEGAIKKYAKLTLQLTSFIVAPVLIGMFSVADNLIIVLLSDEWRMTVPFLRIFCITYLFYPIHTTNINATKACGAGKYLVKMDIIKRILLILILAISINIDVKAIAYGVLILSVIGVFINSFPNRKLISYGIIEQFRDIFPSVLAAIIMGILVFFISYISAVRIVQLIMQIVIGAAVYYFLSKALKNPAMDFLLRYLKRVLHKRS